jgi:hypothetical protein
MSGLWKNDPDTREGKYPVVLRRDGTVPEWAWFVMGQRDPWAPAALRAYAKAAEVDRADPQYVADLRRMADEWESFQADGFLGQNLGDPDAPRHRVDDPDVLNFPRSLKEFVAGIRGRLSGRSA